jgi:glycosyltransferase involved in cell wall biosynthesis
MKKNGHRPLLAAPPKSQIYTRAKASGLTVFPMSFNNLTAIADVIRVRGLLRKVRPHVLNTHGNMDAKVGLIAARGLGIPCVIRSRHHSHPVSPAWHNKLMYRRLSHYIFTTAQCVSDQISKDLAVEPAKVITVASGIIVPDRLTEPEDAICRLQQEFSLDRSARFIGSVAMLRDWKGHRFLVDGFAQIHDQFPHHHLVIVGDGDEMNALTQARDRQGLTHKIHFTGFRDNPWPYFRAFDLNVLASTKNEGIPQVLLQAMYAGCPVIGTCVGGIPDIIENGINGLLVAPENASALARTMAKALNDRQETDKRAKRAFRLVSKNHTIDAMGIRILDLYQRAFSQNM